MVATETRVAAIVQSAEHFYKGEGRGITPALTLK